MSTSAGAEIMIAAGTVATSVAGSIVAITGSIITISTGAIATVAGAIFVAAAGSGCSAAGTRCITRTRIAMSGVVAATGTLPRFNTGRAPAISTSSALSLDNGHSQQTSHQSHKQTNKHFFHDFNVFER